MQHPNAQAVAEAIDAVKRRDPSSFDRYYTPDCVWHVLGDFPMSGTYKGLGEVMAYLSQLFELSGDTFDMDVHDILGSDEHVVTLNTMRGRRADGRVLADNAVSVLHMRDGRIAEMWFYPGDNAAMKEFWS